VPAVLMPLKVIDFVFSCVRRWREQFVKDNCLGTFCRHLRRCVEKVASGWPKTVCRYCS
jgi:hypothetical protein